MSIKTDINQIKKNLINKAKKKGIWENFGQKELNKLKDKHNYISLVYGSSKEREQASLINALNNWCMDFNDNTLNSY